MGGGIHNRPNWSDKQRAIGVLNIAVTTFLTTIFASIPVALDGPNAKGIGDFGQHRLLPETSLLFLGACYSWERPRFQADFSEHLYG
jgi:hypothetical protein